MSDAPDLSRVRLGLVGCGYVSKYHLHTGVTLGSNFAAVCDRDEDTVARVAEASGARPFADADALFDSGLVDAVIVATPHFAHADHVVGALASGLHVFVEKPLAVTVGNARRLVAAATRRPDLVVAVDFNQRAWPLWRDVKRLLDNGTVGRSRDSSGRSRTGSATSSTTTKAIGAARGRGEGGGVLVNQCPHQLDLLCWFFGLPARAMSVTPLGKHHRIEVEDEVHALLDYASGAVGTFTTSTGEAHGRNELEIVGDRATLRVTEQRIEVTRLAGSVREHLLAQPDRKTPPAAAVETIEHAPHDDEYVDMLRDFLTSVVTGHPPIAGPADAARSVELANAILLAGVRRRIVALPVDAGEVDALLAELQARSARP